MGNHTATRARGRVSGTGGAADPGTRSLRDVAKALKQSGGAPSAPNPRSWLREQNNPTDAQEALARAGGSAKALFQHLADEPAGVLEAMAQSSAQQLGARLPQHADRIELARFIANSVGPTRGSAAHEEALLRDEIAMRQAILAERIGAPLKSATTRAPSTSPTPREREAESRAKAAERRATAAERRAAQLERQLATLQAAHDALKARVAGERAAGGASARGWSEKNAAAARSPEPVPAHGPALDAISPYGRTDAYQLRDWYGAGQLRAVLVRLSAPGLREAVDSAQTRNPGTKPSNRTSKDAMVNYLMEHVAPGY